MCPVTVEMSLRVLTVSHTNVVSLSTIHWVSNLNVMAKHVLVECYFITYRGCVSILFRVPKFPVMTR